MNNIVNFFKKPSLKIKAISTLLASLMLISSASRIDSSAKSINKLNSDAISNFTSYETKNSLSNFLSNKFNLKKSFSNDEKRIYDIIKNLEKTKIKDELEKHEKINIKTKNDVVDYYEKILKLILNSTEEFYDDVSISSSRTTLKDYLIKTLSATELTNQTAQNNDLAKSIETAKTHAENIKILKDFRDVSCEILDIIILIKNLEKNQDYQKLIYEYNKNTIDNVNKCAEYCYNIYNKERIAKNYNGTWIFSKEKQHSSYINYSEKENTIFVTFRGTKSCEDVKIDLNFIKKNCAFLNNKGVHSGFLNTYNHFKPEVTKKINELIEKHKDAKIVFTGHSLGGAIATLAALDASTNNEFKDKDISLVSFCAPRSLSKEAFDYTLTNKSIQKLYENSIRVWRTGDVVPSIPFEGYKFNFRHFGKSWCIDKFPDNYKPYKTGIRSWFSYSDWRKWFKSFQSFHGMQEIKNDILKIYENNKEYIDKIKIYKN